MAEPLLSVVVNYFNPRGVERVRCMTKLCLRLFVDFTASRLELLLLDGSGIECDDMNGYCTSIGAGYHPSATSEPFARTYNRGLDMARGDLLALCANDILTVKEWDLALRREMARTGAAMAAPYLSFCDYRSQTRYWVLRSRTFVPSFLTFNLNLMTRECWTKVGPIDEQFTGSYNDLDYLLRIRAAGLEAVIADAGEIAHYGRLTLHTHSENDHHLCHDRFLSKYPSLRLGHEVDYASPLFTRSPLLRRLRKAIRYLPLRARPAGLERLLMRLEPIIHAC